MKKEKPKLKVIQMEEIPLVEIPKVDVTKYIGKKVKIEKAEIIETQYGRAAKFETEVVATEGTEKNPILIKGSKLLSLQQDENGKWGMSEGSKIYEFFKVWGLKTHKDMIGKFVILQATEQKNNVQFLTFI